ncbi:MAG: ABC transporter substrate-binding protein [Acidimicrobiaceae bacterium]|nr:ABC transporter substrate-binding protein [Acidimicrobiaceae bacterium]
MRVKKWMAAVAGVGLGMAGLAACGDSGAPADPKGGVPSIATMKGDPIVIGSICSCTGAQAAILGKSTTGIAAWVNEVNSNGGLNGHPVKLITKDDGADPAKSLQAVKELVEKDKVVAIVGMTTTVDAAWASYVSEHKVPVIGGISAEASFMTNPDFFPSGANAVLQAYGMFAAAKSAGFKKVGMLYCAETPACAQVDGLGKALSPGLGLKYDSAKFSGTAPDYNAPCLSMKQSGVDAIFLASNPEVTERIAASCAQNSYTPQQLQMMNGVDSTMLDDPNFDNTITSGALAAYTDTGIPAIKRYQDALNAYDPGFIETPGFNPMTQFAWSGGVLFEAAAKAVNLGPTSTSADVYKGLYALKGETLDGLTGPLTFTPGKPAFPTCYFQAQIADKKLTDEKTPDPICLDARQLAAMGQLLAALG